MSEGVTGYLYVLSQTALDTQVHCVCDSKSRGVV